MRVFPRALFIALLVTGCQLSQSGMPTITAVSPVTATAADITAAPTINQSTAVIVARPAAVTVESQAVPQTEAQSPTQVQQSPTAVPAASSSGSSSLLVWLDKGTNPAKAGGGQIGLIDRSGTVTPLMDVPSTASRVTACGDTATSPDGRYFAFYIGGDSGNLYLTDGTNAPVMVDPISYLACLNGLRYAPNSSRFGFIDYPANATKSEYAAGRLRIVNTSDLKELTYVDNVVAFDMDNGGAVYVKFFTNNKNEANEASVNLWDGTKEHEVVTVVPTDPPCRFTSAQVGISRDNLLLMMGQRCTSGDKRTRWQLYTIDAVNGSATLAGSDFQPGGFVPYSRTNNLFFAPNGSTAYFTVPDGVTAYTVALASVNLSNMSIGVPVPRQAVFPNFSGAPNAFPQLSPDGRWLSLVVTSPNADNQLLALDLNTPDASPITSGARSRGDIIPDLVFAPDSSHVYYIAGSSDNALYSLDLGVGSEKRIARGNFAEGMALDPAGTTVALLNTATVSDTTQPPFLNLVLVDLTSGDLSTLYVGADTADGKVNNPRFAYPLAWR